MGHASAAHAPQVESTEPPVLSAGAGVVIGAVFMALYLTLLVYLFAASAGSVPAAH
ncbi:hypothetical protein J7643_08845 [bacterium]|nr:hypothetical protein [bacterium]